MAFGRIDWNNSIEQQIDEIVRAMSSAHRLVQQIERKHGVRAELITKENHSCFQSVICLMRHLVFEIERNPLYQPALLQLRNRQMRKRRRILAKHFGITAQVVDGNFGR
jgi:hypothetical protein